MVKYEITIKVDTNDGDYATEISTISDSDLDKIKPLIAAIKKFQPYKTKSESGMDWEHSHNYPYGEVLREDLGEKEPRDYYHGVVSNNDVFDLFEDLLPYGEYGFHTIVSIDVTPLVKKAKLL